MARAAPVVPIRFAPLACRGRPLPSSVAGRDMETCHAIRWIHGGLIPPCPCGTPTEDQVRRASGTAAATLLPDLRDLPRAADRLGGRACANQRSRAATGAGCPATRRIGSRSHWVAVLASCGRSGSADRSKDSCQPSSSWVMSVCDGGVGFRLLHLVFELLAAFVESFAHQVGVDVRG